MVNYFAEIYRNVKGLKRYLNAFICNIFKDAIVQLAFLFIIKPDVYLVNRLTLSQCCMSSTRVTWHPHWKACTCHLPCTYAIFWTDGMILAKILAINNVTCSANKPFSICLIFSYHTLYSNRARIFYIFLFIERIGSQTETKVTISGSTK